MEKVRNENMFWKGEEITRINVMHFPLLVFRGEHLAAIMTMIEPVMEEVILEEMMLKVVM